MTGEFNVLPDMAVITLKRILTSSKPILVVKHGTDGYWEFLDGDTVVETDAAVVSFKEVLTLDSTLNKLAKLMPGQTATRKDVTDTWVIS